LFATTILENIPYGKKDAIMEEEKVEEATNVANAYSFKSRGLGNEGFSYLEVKNNAWQ